MRQLYTRNASTAFTAAEQELCSLIYAGINLNDDVIAHPVRFHIALLPAVFVWQPPNQTVLEIFTDLEVWNEWSVALHVSSRWTGDIQWEIGSTFMQDLDMGMLGQSTSDETITHLIDGEMVMWCKDENGLRSCHI